MQPEAFGSAVALPWAVYFFCQLLTVVSENQLSTSLLLRAFITELELAERCVLEEVPFPPCCRSRKYWETQVLGESSGVSVVFGKVLPPAPGEMSLGCRFFACDGKLDLVTGVAAFPKVMVRRMLAGQQWGPLCHRY